MYRNPIMSGVIAGLFAQDPMSGAAAAAGSPASTDGTKKTRAPKTNLLDIVRGRLPLLFVASIRYKEKGTNAETAKKYATSVGKVFDIKKGRNFEYVTEDYKPTQEDVAAAKAWAVSAASHGGDKGGLEDVVASYKLATPEEAKAQGEAFTKARSKPQANAGAGKPAAAATNIGATPASAKKLVA